MVGEDFQQNTVFFFVSVAVAASHIVHVLQVKGWIRVGISSLSRRRRESIEGE
jgi:hypothetical protein